MTWRSLQGRYAPDSRCFGCGPANPDGLHIESKVGDDGELVDTLGFFSFDGALVKTHTWPRSLRGETAELQAEVDGDGGTQRAVLEVRVN